MRLLVTFVATAGLVASVVVLRRGPATDQRLDHEKLIRRLDGLHTKSNIRFHGIPTLQTEPQLLMG